MDRKEWLAGLSAGDDVVVAWGRRRGYGFKKERVKRVTPTGIIVLVDGTTYRPTGAQRGDGRGVLHDPGDSKTVEAARKAKADAKARRAAARIRSLGVALEGEGFRLSRENVEIVLSYVDEVARQQDAGGLVEKVEDATK